MKIFITGTDTNVGKTIVSSWLSYHYNFHYWKPIQSGDDNGISDTEFMRKICNLNENIKIFDPIYSFPDHLSPHIAAKINNESIDLSKIINSSPNEKKLLIEGAGGVFVPINEKFLMIDLMEVLEAPVIIVARSGLGTINHTILTLEALRERRIKVLGVILNGEKNIENKKAIEFYGKIKVIFEFPKLEDDLVHSIHLMKLEDVFLDRMLYVS
jgi:dethiobiotin synthetase